jgi:hypothetical protein
MFGILFFIETQFGCQGTILFVVTRALKRTGNGIYGCLSIGNNNLCFGR